MCATRQWDYWNGFSWSLPIDIQFAALHTVPGLEHMRAYRPGYAIEYDFFDPTQLSHTLETKLVKHLFFAGQINGTTGYEEAAGQGLIAGINAHQNCHHGAPFILGRDEAYIGVLIDDLVTKGVDEPYRMFTSRAEYRILLRQDDADARLTPRAFELGLAKRERMDLLISKQAAVSSLLNYTKTRLVKGEEVDGLLASVGSSVLKQSQKLYDLILRPQLNVAILADALPDFAEQISLIDDNRKEEILESVEIQIKYAGYIEREKMIAEKLTRLEHIQIKGKFDYNTLQSLSTEARQKLLKIDPETIGQAARIPGISPHDINVLLVLLGR